MSETPQQYRQRMFDNTAHQDPVKIQAVAPAKIQKLIRNLSEAKLKKRPAPGKWSVGEIVAHLADTELVAGYRIRVILGAPGSPIQAFDQDQWATNMNYGSRRTKDSLAAFRAMREHNLALLKKLKPAQWEQHGMHAERGEESVRTIVKMMAGHDVNHIKQIEAIVKTKKR